MKFFNHLFKLIAGLSAVITVGMAGGLEVGTLTCREAFFGGMAFMLIAFLSGKASTYFEEE